jgi:ADP-heptose:LPS heptosyltransferase
MFVLDIPAKAYENIKTLLSNNGIAPDKPFVAVHPGGGWISRRWMTERYAALIDKITSETGLPVVLVGGKEGGAGEKGLNEEIKGMAKSRIVDLTSMLDIKELAALLKKSAVFIANEAGPMHIATALGVPSVAILGPTDPARTGPFGKGTTIIQHKVECQPCRERSCKKRTCMELVTVDEVFSTVKGKLKGTG